VPGYQQPCRYCDTLVPPESNVCPACGKVNPVGPLRCAVCRAPIRESWVSCSNCGLSLRARCPACGAETFAGDYCSACGARLAVRCSNRGCGAEQHLLATACGECGAALHKTGG